MGSLKDFELELKNTKGKPGHPRDINFSFDSNGKTLQAELVGKFTKKDFRRFDPYTLLCLAEAKEKTNAKVSKVVFTINQGKNNDGLFMLNFESLKRRISFLSINNNNIQFELFLNNAKIELYDKKSLFNRPTNEIIRSKVSKRSEDNDPRHLEKAFQAFLNGKGLETRTNERLAILGEDFYQIKDKGFGILREFPTGVFDKKESDNTRITPTELIDLVTLNKWGHLAVIEIKLDNSELEVISQILDYGLYFACYRDLLMKMPCIATMFDVKAIQKKDIYCYVVNNRFHSRFPDILRFYSTKSKNYGFCLKKIVLGETEEV